MATSPSVFTFAHIALTATITAVFALLVLVVLRPRFKMLSLVDCLLVAVVVGNAAHGVEICGQYRGIEQRSHSRCEPE